MELKTKVFSNGDVDVEATMKDVALCDDQKHRQGRNTGYECGDIITIVICKYVKSFSLLHVQQSCDSALH